MMFRVGARGGTHCLRNLSRCSYRCVAIALLLLAPFIFWPAAGPAQRSHFIAHSDEDGLGNTSVTALAQDRNGFTLLGTESGVFRYDGLIVQPVTYSGGLAWLREDETVLTLIGWADALLYQAKWGGRDRLDIERVRSPTPAVA